MPSKDWEKEHSIGEYGPDTGLSWKGSEGGSGYLFGLVYRSGEYLTPPVWSSVGGFFNGSRVVTCYERGYAHKIFLDLSGLGLKTGEEDL